MFYVMKEWEIIEGVNEEICEIRNNYYVDFISMYLNFCEDNGVVLEPDSEKFINHFNEIKDDMDMSLFVKYDHLKTISIHIDMFKDEAFTSSLYNHIKMCERKRKINNVLKD